MPGVLARCLNPASPLLDAVKPGKQGLKRQDRSRVEEQPPARVTDSMDLDEACARAEPSSPRWDYWIGVSSETERVVAAEVHPATAGEVKKVIAKKVWGVQKAREHLGCGVARWCWIASGKVAITKNSREYRQLSSAGIELVGRKLVLR